VANGGIEVEEAENPLGVPHGRVRAAGRARAVTALTQPA
jgi:hypothetical protein